MLLRLICLSFVSFGLSQCGIVKKITGGKKWKGPKDEVIYDVSAFDKKLFKDGNPVGSLIYNESADMMGLCTAFAISDSRIMTNHHCITNASDAVNAVATFNFAAGAPLDKTKKYKCDRFIGNNEELDYALLECDDDPGKIYGSVSLNTSESLELNNRIYVIHQNCDYKSDPDCIPHKKYSEGTIIKNTRDVPGYEEDTAHNADTLGGSSGSPVFAFNNEVIGIHHAGRGNFFTGRGDINFFVPMKKIVADLQRTFSFVELKQLPANLSLIDNSNSDVVDLDTDEPNNSISRAKALPFPAMVQARIKDESDRDYFQFTITKTRRVVTSLYFKNSLGNLNLGLYNYKKQLIRSSRSRADREIIDVNLKPGRYYVLVIGGSVGASNTYQLSIKTR
jgi:V8-like Glu-specific endopeptidase